MQSMGSHSVGRDWSDLVAAAAAVIKNPPANAGDVRNMGSIPGLGRPPGGEHGNPLQYCCLENPVDGGAWWATFHGVAKSQTRLSDWTATEIPERWTQLLRCWPAVFPLCLAKRIKLFFLFPPDSISVWDQWTRSQDFGNSADSIFFLQDGSVWFRCTQL